MAMAVVVLAACGAPEETVVETATPVVAPRAEVPEAVAAPQPAEERCASMIRATEEAPWLLEAGRSQALLSGQVAGVRRDRWSNVVVTLRDAIESSIERGNEPRFSAELVIGDPGAPRAAFFFGAARAADGVTLGRARRGQMLAVWVHRSRTSPREYVVAGQVRTAIVEPGDVDAARDQVQALGRGYRQCAPLLRRRLGSCSARVTSALFGLGAARWFLQMDTQLSEDELTGIHEEIRLRELDVESALAEVARADPATLVALMDTPLVDGPEDFVTQSGGSYSFGGHGREGNTFSALDAVLAEASSLPGCATSTSLHRPEARRSCAALWMNRLADCAAGLGDGAPALDAAPRGESPDSR